MDVEYRVRGSEIYFYKDGEEKPLALLGVTWSGFEVRSYVVGGLTARRWVDILETVKSLGFNAIRIPFCAATARPGTRPALRVVNYALNSDLGGLDSVSVMERIVAKAAELGMHILLCFHNISCVYFEPLWYTPVFTEQSFIETWLYIAKRFGRYWNVVGAELFNSPHATKFASSEYTRSDVATWGMGNPKTDWNLAAERIGKAVLEVAPHWLIVVKGVQISNPKSDNVPLYSTEVFWGENLRAVRDYPVNLPREKLVYSVNTYGPDVYVQQYFNDPSVFPDNLYKIWDQNWGYVKKQLGYPIIVAEFGGKHGEGDPRDAIWHKKFVEYLIENNICHWFYLALNPGHELTNGLLQPDWKTPQPHKFSTLKTLIDYCVTRYSKA
jgi:endoglucanase